MKTKIVKVSADGQLRLVKLGRGYGRVELNNHGVWVWCVCEKIAMPRAWELFTTQAETYYSGEER